MAVNTAGRLHLWKHALRNSEPFQNVLVPFLFMNVKQNGTGRVGIIRNKNLSLRQVPDQPGVHRTEEQLALLSHPSGSLYMIQNPFDLRSGKISVRDQSGALSDQPVKALLLQPVDLLRSSAALPADGIVDRPSRLSGKADCGFPLVGDTDRRNIRRLRSDLPHGLHSHAELGGPDLQRIMLHPARLRINLSKFFLRGRAHMPHPVEQNTARTGRPLIQRHHVFCHSPLLFLLPETAFKTIKSVRPGHSAARACRPAPIPFLKPLRL